MVLKKVLVMLHKVLVMLQVMLMTQLKLAYKILLIKLNLHIRQVVRHRMLDQV